MITKRDPAKPIAPMIHDDDRHLVAPVQDAVFACGTLVMRGTNVRLGDVVARFVHGDNVAGLAADYEVTVGAIEAALRTALRALHRAP